MNSKRKLLIWGAVFVAIVIVPTLCLLWFMEQALRNEQLSSQEKLRQVYSARIERSEWNLREHIIAFPNAEQDQLKALEEIYTSGVVGAFLVQEKEVLFPHERNKGKGAPLHQELWSKEFVEHEYRVAAEAYLQEYGRSNSTGDSLHNLLSAARCYKKLGDTAATLETYATALSRFEITDSTEELCHALLVSATLQSKVNSEMKDSLIVSLLQRPLWQVSTSMRQFFYASSISLLKQCVESECCALALEDMQKKFAFEQRSAQWSKEFTVEDLEDSLPIGKIVYRDSLFITRIVQDSLQAVLVLSKENLNNLLNKKMNQFDEPALHAELVFNDQNSAEKRSPLSVITLPNFDGIYCSIAFYLNEEKATPQTVQSQKATYLWIGFLSIFFIVIAGISAAYFFIHQHNLNRLKNTFLATVTHELKTPIASCRLLVDTLLGKKVTDPTKVEEYLVLLSRENLRLSRLVDNFLTFSRMERNKQNFKREECLLSEIVAPALDSLSVKLHTADCHFTIEQPLEDIELYANRDALITVLTNLLDNAYKYSLEEKLIHLKIDASDTEIALVVSDKGMGIRKKEVKKIFQKFYRVDQKLNRQQEGCGLGLSIVSYIVKAHLGTVAVESIWGEGTTFTVTLPR